MRAFSDNMYDSELARYFDLMHQHRNYQHECQVADEIIQQSFPKAIHILDLGCGTGEHAIRMAQRGYCVTAIDPSPAMLACAQEKATEAGVQIDFQCTDIQQFRGEQKFHAIYCLGYTFLYLTTYPDIINFLESTVQRLVRGGAFLLDFIQGWSLIENYPRDKFCYTDATGTIFCFQQSCLKKLERVRHIEFYYVIQSPDRVSKMILAEEDLRIFFDDEVEMLLRQSGLEHIATYHDYTLDANAPSKDGAITLMAGVKSNSPKNSVTA